MGREKCFQTENIHDRLKNPAFEHKMKANYS